MGLACREFAPYWRAISTYFRGRSPITHDKPVSGSRELKSASKIIATYASRLYAENCQKETGTAVAKYITTRVKLHAGLVRAGAHMRTRARASRSKIYWYAHARIDTSNVTVVSVDRRRDTRVPLIYVQITTNCTRQIRCATNRESIKRNKKKRASQKLPLIRLDRTCFRTNRCAAFDVSNKNPKSKSTTLIGKVNCTDLDGSRKQTQTTTTTNSFTLCCFFTHCLSLTETTSLSGPATFRHTRDLK